MIVRVPFRVLPLLAMAVLVVICTGGPLGAQPPAAPPQAAAGDQAADAEPAADPYEVPDGSIEELLAYIQTGAERMHPTTQDDIRRMFRSLDTAAQRVYESDQAPVDLRVEMAGARVIFLGRLALLGDQQAQGQLTTFLNKVSQDPAPELQEFAEEAQLDQKIARWPSATPGERKQLLATVRANLEADPTSTDHLVTLLRVADAASETSETEGVVELIEEVLPQLRDSQEPRLAERVEQLEGLARRIQLPGSKLEVEGNLLSGEPVDWESYRGKVVLVDYWATWCGPCMDELPNVIEAYETYHDKGFDVLGISLDEDQEAVEGFYQARKLPWQTLFKPDYAEGEDGWDHPMAVKYAINAIPRAILVDQEGKVVSVAAYGDTLDKHLAELLGPAESSASEDAQ